MLRRVAAFALVTSVALLVSLPCLRNAPAFDDEHLIFNNPYAQSLSYLGESLTRDFFYAPTDARLGYYRPLTKLAFLVQYQLFGPSVPGYHVVSLLAFFAVLGAGAWLLRESGASGRCTTLALALFASHPAQGRTLSTIAPQSDVFVTLGILLALAAYLRARRETPDAQGFLVLAWLSGAFALGCKELGVILPGAVLAWELGREPRAAISGNGLRRLAPFVALVVGYAGLRAAFGVLPIAGESTPVLQALATACKLGVGAVVRSVVPLAWSPELHEARPSASLADAVIWLVPWLALCAAGLVAFRRVPRLRLGTILLFLPLAPLLAGQALIRGSEDPDTLFLADRWLYVTAFGGSVVIAVVLDAALSALDRRPLAHALHVALGALVLVQTLLTVEESASFTDEGSRLVFLGLVYREGGSDTRHARAVMLAADAVLAERRGDVAASVRAYAAQLQAQPGNSTAHYNLAVVLLRAGRAREAHEHAFVALYARAPDGSYTLPAHYSFERRRPEKAFLLGQTLEALGDRAAAQRAFELCVTLAPAFAPAREKLASYASPAR